MSELQKTPKVEVDELAPTKLFWQSKTMGLNLVFIVGLVGKLLVDPAILASIPPEYLSIVLIIGYVLNVYLRSLGGDPLSLKKPIKKE